jgi:Icc-related predicted phosphoesterase
MPDVNLKPGAPLRIAAASDIHYTRNSRGQCRELFLHASERADVLVLCGDLTDYGLAEEAHILAEDLHASCRIPVLAVLGNHDFESGHPHEVATILEQAGVRMLDGECVEIGGVGFVGVCGFGGGFGARMLNAWGEPAIKHFVQEAVDQAMKLERALARLETQKRVAVLHYAPIRDTVVGEDPEIFPFLGSTRLEGPLNRFNVTAAFHGHAHRGAHEGRTSTGIHVYNVAVPVMKRVHPDQPAFKLLEVERDDG